MKANEHVERVKTLLAGVAAMEDIKEEFSGAEEYVESLDETTGTLLEMAGREIEWAIRDHSQR